MTRDHDCPDVSMRWSNVSNETSWTMNCDLACGIALEPQASFSGGKFNISCATAPEIVRPHLYAIQRPQLALYSILLPQGTYRAVFRHRPREAYRSTCKDATPRWYGRRSGMEYSTSFTSCRALAPTTRCINPGFATSTENHFRIS